MAWTESSSPLVRFRALPRGESSLATGRLDEGSPCNPCFGPHTSASPLVRMMRGFHERGRVAILWPIAKGVHGAWARWELSCSSLVPPPHLSPSLAITLAKSLPIPLPGARRACAGELGAAAMALAELGRVAGKGLEDGRGGGGRGGRQARHDRRRAQISRARVGRAQERTAGARQLLSSRCAIAPRGRAPPTTTR
jgi:hypothetical protein